MSHSKLDVLAKERALRGIVEHKQHGCVCGSRVDLFSASAIVLLLDALNPANKAKYLTLHPYKMAEIAFKFVK